MPKIQIQVLKNFGTPQNKRFSKIHLQCRWIFEKPQDPPILKNLDLNFENDRNFQLDRNFEQNLNLLHTQKYDAIRKRHVSPSFFGKDWQFFGGTPFFRGGHQIFDFYKNLESKIRLPRAWSPKRQNQAKFVLQHEFMPILTPIKETWQNWRHKTNVLTTKTFTLTEKFLKKRKKSSVAHLQNSTWQTNTHNTELPSLYYTI